MAIGDALGPVVGTSVDSVTGLGVGDGVGAFVSSAVSSCSSVAASATGTSVVRGSLGLVGVDVSGASTAVGASVGATVVFDIRLAGMQKSVLEYSVSPPIQPGTAVSGSRWKQTSPVSHLIFEMRGMAG